MDGVKSPVARLTRFQQLIGAPVRDYLCTGVVHALAFPVTLSVMVREDFPLSVPGMVQLRNSAEHFRPIHTDEVLTVVAWSEGLAAHRGGTQADLVAEVCAGGDLVWRGRSTYLAKGYRPATAESPHPARDGGRPARFIPTLPTAHWALGGGIGRSYAAVSGDYNPIHLSCLGARLFGMKAPVAHGMYLASRMVEEALPAGEPAFAWSVDFHRPVYLPARVAVAVAQRREPAGESGSAGRGARRRQGRWRETAVNAWDPRQRRLHFTGNLRPLAAGRV
jgi:acyl dehydratase